MSNKTARLLIYIDRQKIIFAANFLATPLIHEFSASVVSDLQVIDYELAETQLLALLTQHKINPCETIIVFSPTTYFDQTLTLQNDPQAKEQAINFFSASIPFDNLFIKDYVIGNNLSLVAFNKDFFDPFLRFFRRRQFVITSVIPAFVLSSLQINFTDFSLDQLNALFASSKTLTSYSVLSPQDIDKNFSGIPPKAKQDNHRAFILIIFMSILFVIFLALLFFRSSIIKSKPKISPLKNIYTPTQALSPTPTSITYIDNVVIKIINGSGVPSLTTKLTKSLKAEGFNELSSSTSGKISSDKNSVTYPLNLSPDLKEKIKLIIADITDSSVFEKETADTTSNEVIITLVSSPE